MKKLLLVLLVLAMPAVVSAQNDVCVGTLCHTPSADEIASQVYQRDKHNTQVCTGVGLPASCSQAEYDAVLGGPLATVYTNDAAGVRQKFLDKLKIDIAAAVSTQRAEQKSRAYAAWADASQADRDGACTALTGSADCQ